MNHLIENPLQHSPYISDHILNDKICDLERNIALMTTEIQTIKNNELQKQEIEHPRNDTCNSSCCCSFILFVILFVLIIILYTNRNSD